jgi:hypothetical protein
VSASLYVIEFSSGVVKVGVSEKPDHRMADHAMNARVHGHTVVNTWTSSKHANARQTERELIEFCSGRWSTVAGREYFTEAVFAEVVAFAECLALEPADDECGMSAPPPFDWAEAEALCGSAAIAKAKRLAEEGYRNHPITPEQGAQLRALVASTPRRRTNPAA